MTQPEKWSPAESQTVFHLGWGRALHTGMPKDSWGASGGKVRVHPFVPSIEILPEGASISSDLVADSTRLAIFALLECLDTLGIFTHVQEWGEGRCFN